MTMDFVLFFSWTLTFSHMACLSLFAFFFFHSPLHANKDRYINNTIILFDKQCSFPWQLMMTTLELWPYISNLCLHCSLKSSNAISAFSIRTHSDGHKWWLTACDSEGKKDSLRQSPDLCHISSPDSTRRKRKYLRY